ncbi:RAMP superfamily CRISPR-associated protein [Tepidimonas sp.]|uniref:RAMP superfamily CRISPR-associated protein n=1 Tax=Tepidimonas sp. TaxID=2002775 RepID=UPI00391DA50C
MTEMTVTAARPKNAAGPMRTCAYQLTFLTPAFLGDAQQSGRWRTPPFKAQLRQWWRMVWAADHGFAGSVDVMRREEGLLFGNAWLENDFRKSLVRLRLERWDLGNETPQSWGRQELDRHKEGVSHPEVGSIGPKLYLGYGPLVVEKVQRAAQRPEYATVLKNNAAIQNGETATLSLTVPQAHAERIERALWLMHQFGTVGGRSRNGWGSYALEPINGTPQLEGDLPLRPWRDCLKLDWPHALGQDEKGPLIWQTVPHDDWKSLMKTLAIIKIGLRTQFRFTSGKNAPNPEARHWLSYPVTNHSVQPWGNNARLPNQLRFKVRKTAEGKLVGVIVHVSHLPPPAFQPDRATIERVWRQVHAFLDAPAQKLTRIQGPQS